jgi:paraquat-inducible protein B
MPTRNEVTQAARLPRAVEKRGWNMSPVWIVPLAASAFLGYLAYQWFIEKGSSVIVRFQDGKGIEVGKTMVRYRGVQIGTVTDLRLTKDLKNVEVTAQLTGSSAELAREGAQFWIVRPEVSAGSIRGLGTLVAGNYIQAEPGRGAKTNRFTGVENPPLILPGQTNGLRVNLLAAQLRSMSPGSPVFYRGIKVGQVVQNQLSSEAQTVQIEIYVQPQFANLVRKNSEFWNAGGIDAKVTLFGADISAQSLQALVTGGIAFATPNAPEKPAPNGTTFRLYDRAREEWLNWAPSIKLPPGLTNSVEEQFE